ncbi:MAG: cobalamin B12-binding domain-containing protein [Carbonactinosporaceae bacterium]
MSTHRPGRRTSVLVAKPGLDGHDRGAKIVARALRDAGMEVIYLGIRQTPAEIAAAAVQEDVDVVGLSILSGSHLKLARRVKDELAARDADDIPILVGGTIPARDVQPLLDLGVAAVLPTSTPMDAAVAAVRAAAAPSPGSADARA